MFAELLVSAAFGFVKGLYDKRGARTHSSFAGAVVEEALFRGLLPPAAGLAGFVASHRPKTATRAADVMLGGLLYGSAMKRFGLWGAVGAHLAHNVAIGFGRRVR